MQNVHVFSACSYKLYVISMSTNKLKLTPAQKTATLHSDTHCNTPTDIISTIPSPMPNCIPSPDRHIHLNTHRPSDDVSFVYIQDSFEYNSEFHIILLHSFFPFIH